ncbi:MAG TPA: hypothetical protein VGB66_17215 [Longimicrobium sp.]
MKPKRLIHVRALALVLCVAALGACEDNLVETRPPDPEEPAGEVRPLGLVEVTVTGLGTAQATATATGLSSVLTTPQNTAATANGSIQMEQVTTGSFTEGTRGADGQRYLYATFRVRNAQQDSAAYDTPRRNLTFLAVSTGSTIPGTPVSRLRRFDGSAADSSIAAKVIPTGAVALGDSLQMRSLRADVLQVFAESDLPSGASVPPAVTSVFPYGFVVSNPNNGNSRDLPASPGPDQFDGLVTFAFRVPLQPSDAGTTNGSTKDVFTLSLMFMAVDDSETRVTESIEEQTMAGRTALLARASALGATTVTVLNGSPAGVTVPAYTGQRQLCSVRTAGPAGSATATVNAPGAYTRLAFYTGTETPDGCAANFRTGAAARPAVGVSFPVRVYAMDRYGNTITTLADSATLLSKTSSTPPPVTRSAGAALVNGTATLSATYGGYGADTLYAVGRRVRGALPVTIAGVVRVWEGDVSTDWNTGANWQWGAPPFPLDTVQIPVVGTSLYPELVENESIGGVVVADGAALRLGSFNLTASSSVTSAPFSGGIESVAGRLYLTGVAQNLSGRVPRLIVTGSYILTGNVQAVAPLRVEGGRLRNTTFRMRVDPQ